MKYVGTNLANGAVFAARGLYFIVVRRHWNSTTVSVEWYKTEKAAKEAASKFYTGADVVRTGYNPSVLWDDKLGHFERFDTLSAAYEAATKET